MRTLVTGGAGFLGCHLCERLLAEGHEVICLDNLKSGRRENIAHLISRPDFHFLLHDITLPVFLDGPVDYVLHLASLASPKDYLQEPIHTLKVGALGTHNTLGLAKAKKSTILLASSSEVYGDPEVNPQPESYWGRVNPVGPRSVYDESKRYTEAIGAAYYRVHGVQVRIARIFNTYGPRMRIADGRALPMFMTQALLGEPLTIHGDGSQTRSLCYVTDLIEGLWRLLTMQSSQAVIVNLGNPEEVTMRDLAREILEVTESQSSITYLPLPQDDPKVRKPDITRAQQLLGWKPAVSRAQGLRKVLPYFQEAIRR